MSQATDRAVRRCPNCGSRLAIAARACTICGAAVPWRLTPRGIVTESILAVGLAAATIGGLLWARSRWTAPVSPAQVAVDQLASHTPTDMPTFTPLPQETRSAPPSSVADAVPSIAPATPSTSPTFTTHVIESGDSLYAIAMANGITLDELLAANPGMTTDSFLAIGQELRVPAPDAAPPAGANSETVAPDSTSSGEAASADPEATPAASEVTVGASTSEAGASVHIVAPGDTLLAIAENSATTIDELVAWNALPGADAVLSIGQQITVRPTQAATAASAADTRGDPEHRPQLGESIEPSVAFAAPELLAPGNGATLVDETPYLRWASAGILPDAAYYVVLIREAPMAAPETGTTPPPPPTDLEGVEIVWSLDNATAIRMPMRFRPAFGASIRLQWAVAVRRRADGLIETGLGEALSPFSTWRTFTWAPGGE